MHPIEPLRPTEKRVRMIILCILMALVIFVWYLLWTCSRPLLLTITFLKVGQGDAILIASPSGNKMLIDGGPDRMALVSLGKEMRWYDKKIDVVMNSHPDLDHIGGLPAVLEKYTASYLIDPGIETHSSVQNRLYELARVKGMRHIVGRRGQIIDLGAGVYAHILFPDRDVSFWKKTNNASLFVKVIYGKSSFLLSGDAPIVMENYVVSLDKEKLISTVLKAGHHGSKTSSSELFIRTTSPKVAALSYGKNNRYGHPNKEVLDRFAEFGIPSFATEAGSVRFCSNREVVWKC